MNLKSGSSGGGDGVFRLRFIQLLREPFFWFVLVVGFALVCFSTVLGPLPSFDKGIAWRDLIFSAGTLCGWFFAFFIALNSSGRLLEGLPALPISRALARWAWLMAESVILICLLLPVLVLGLAFLPGGPVATDLILVALVIAQGLFFVGIGGVLREFCPFTGVRILGLLAALVLFSLPPLSWADPRVVFLQPNPSSGLFFGAFSVWLGGWAAGGAARALFPYAKPNETST